MSFRKWRHKMAFMFGRREHLTSRLLFAGLIITYGLFWLKYYYWVNVMLLVDIALWLFYWFFHRMEKMSFPGNSMRKK